MPKLVFCFFLFLTLKVFGQCQVSFSTNVTPPSCSVCCDGSIQLTNLTGCAPFAATISPTGAFTGLTANNLCPGVYSITAFDAGCCTPVTQTCNIGPGPTTIMESNSSLGLSVYPNPASTTLFISLKQNNIHEPGIEIINVLGQTVLKIPYKNEIDVSGLANGYYVLRLTNSGKPLFFSRFVKE